MTTSTQLNAVCRGTPGFRGVFAADQLPDDIRPGDSLIANYDTHDEDGTHWVAMRFPANAPAEFFDSFGLAPDQADRLLERETHFRQYLARHSAAAGAWAWNRFDFQCLRDNTCGEFAAAFVVIGGLPQDPSRKKLWGPIAKPMTCKKRGKAVRKVIGIRA